jgi:hypothetical protein
LRWNFGKRFGVPPSRKRARIGRAMAARGGRRCVAGVVASAHRARQSSSHREVIAVKIGKTWGAPLAEP